MTDALFQPFVLGGAVELCNRIVMAPMTRCLAGPGLIVGPESARYYARRAGAGLIVSEGVIIRPDAQGYPDTPGLFTKEQGAGWKAVTRAVHDRGGKIFSQLWHVGRVSHPVYLAGHPPVAPSAVAISGPVSRRADLSYGTPRALERSEIPVVVNDYAAAAERAMEAGFDGVEIHGANGYLIDQFLHGSANLRADEYGGETENMARFALEVVDAVVAKTGPGRTGIRLSPGAYHYIKPDKKDPEVFRFLLGKLEARPLAYVHVGIFDDGHEFSYLGGAASAFLRRHYRGTLVGCGGYTPESGAAAVKAGRFDLLGLGRPFIANPDLVDKIRAQKDLIPYAESMLASLD